MIHKSLLICLVCLSILVVPVAADTITDWNTIAIQAIQAQKFTSVPASRTLAMVHAAMYDALNSVEKTGKVYYIRRPTSGASADAAAATAAYCVLNGLFPAQDTTLSLSLQSSLASIPDGDAKERGISLGYAVGQAMLAWRAKDRSDKMVNYAPGTKPGEWRPTPPNFAGAMLPHWGNVIPFALKRGSAFRPLAPYALRSREYAQELNEVMMIGGKTSAHRTPEQTAIAMFWADSPGTVTTVGRWNLIAQQVSARAGCTLVENARLFAVMNIALADAGIAAWDCKYRYNYWRPITAIHQAELDGNKATHADPSWEPLLMTPAFPEYVSAHSTFSAAAATVLTYFFGNNQQFTIAPYPPMTGMMPPARTYTAFCDAAEEAGRSRIYGGIHFENGNRKGLFLGWQIGQYVCWTECLPYCWR